jgi:hypothetical protein
MKQLLFGALVALGLAATAAPVQAAWCIDYSVCRHIGITYTGRSRCLNYTSCSNPLPGCAPGGYAGPALWDSMAAYGAHPYAVAAAPAPVATAPAAPANTAPSFKAPQPTPATKSTGLQQAVYYYGQPTSTGYDYNAGYGYSAGYSYYGYGSGYSYAQVPNYWY